MGPKRALSPEQEKAILARLSAGEPALAVSRDYPQVSLQTIHNTRKRYGVEVHPSLQKRRLTKEQQARVVETCLSDVRVDTVAEMFNTSPETVFRILRAHKISLEKGRPRSHTVNDHTFDALSPEACYWIGFLFADGCIYEDKYGSPSVILCLGEKDYAHVERFRAFLGSTHAITVSAPKRNKPIGNGTLHSGACAWFRVRSKGLFAALTSYGMVKKRTRSPCPELVASRDFWRGMVDGDGWLAMNVYPYIGLSGQKLLLEAFQRFLAQEHLAVPNITPTESGIWRVQIGTANASALIKELYTDAVEALPRKLARAKAIISGDTTKSESYIEGPSREALDDDDLVESAEE